MASSQTTAAVDGGQHSYEMVYIARPDLGDDGVKVINDRLTQAIVAQGGEMQTSENWGKRNLAYRIQKYSEGHYVLHRYMMMPKGTAELDRLLRFNEDVIRFLIIRTDE